MGRVASGVCPLLHACNLPSSFSAFLCLTRARRWGTCVACLALPHFWSAFPPSAAPNSKAVSERERIIPSRSSDPQLHVCSPSPQSRLFYNPAGEQLRSIGHPRCGLHDGAPPCVSVFLCFFPLFKFFYWEFADILASQEQHHKRPPVRFSPPFLPVFLLSAPKRQSLKFELFDIAIPLRVVDNRSCLFFFLPRFRPHIRPSTCLF